MYIIYTYIVMYTESKNECNKSEYGGKGVFQRASSLVRCGALAKSFCVSCLIAARYWRDLVTLVDYNYINMDYMGPCAGCDTLGFTWI